MLEHPWLDEVRYPQSSRSSFISKVHIVKSDVGCYEIATNGHVLVAVERSTSEETVTDRERKTLLDKIIPVGTAFIADFSALKEWVGADTWHVCEFCGGKGENNCPACETEIDCEVCQCQGVTGFDDDYGLIHGIILNRCYLAKPFANLSAEKITIYVQNDDKLVLFAGPDWFVALMPINKDKVSADGMPEFQGLSK